MKMMMRIDSISTNQKLIKIGNNTFDLRQKINKYEMSMITNLVVITYADMQITYD